MQRALGGTVIGLETLDALLDQRHTLGLYCMACDRWSDADLETLVAQGLGDRLVTDARFRCRACGGLAEKQVRPPVPGIGAARAYIEVTADSDHPGR